MPYLHCAKLCRESYNPELPEGFIDVEDLRFGIRETETQIFVVFRGTANAANVLRDIWVRPSKTVKGYLVHKGFESGFNILFTIVKQLIAKSKKELVFTGHSFGGAVALLFAEFYNAKVITFGCPRVYFRFWKAPKEVEHKRFVCDDDPVPMIPRLFYRHLCEATVLKDKDGGIDVKDHSISVYCKRLENIA